MQSPELMATTHVDFDQEITRRIQRHEQHIKWSVLAFAVAIVVMALLWISFLGYL
jgi:hypothetical protein